MIRKHVPNFLTSCNLLCGCLGLYACMQQHADEAAFMIILASFFDYFDGFAARLLHVKSAIGKELDSLADVVSFGVLPGFILFTLLNSLEPISSDYPKFSNLLPFLAFLLPVFSALRLAKFNIDERQTEHFIGMPTPANALLIATFPLILDPRFQFGFFHFDFIAILIAQPIFLLAYCIIFSYLLVSPLRMFSLKFSHFGMKGNFLRYVFLLFTVTGIILSGLTGLFFSMILYVIISVVSAIEGRKTT